MILPGHRLVSWNMSSRSILLASPPCLLPQQRSEEGRGVKLRYFSPAPPCGPSKVAALARKPLARLLCLQVWALALSLTLTTFWS